MSLCYYSDMYLYMCYNSNFRAVDHPAAPESRKYVRVKSYYSEMVIKPHSFVDEVRHVHVLLLLYGIHVHVAWISL